MSDDLNPEAEEIYLVSLLLPVTTRMLRDEALRAVAPDDFWSPFFGALWRAGRRLVEAESPVTRRALLAIGSEPAQLPAFHPPIQAAALARTLDHLPTSVPPAAEFPAAVAQVRRCGQLRRLVQFTERVRQRAYVAEDYAQALTMATEEFAALTAGTEAQEPGVLAFGPLLERFVVAQDSNEVVRRFPSPWPEINDELSGGLHGGRLYVIGARPGDGKSLAAHQIAEYAASNRSPALVFSVEMGADEVTGRVVSSGAQVEMRDISRRELDAYSWQRVLEYVDRAKGYPLWIVDKSDLSVPYIKSVCRNQKRRTGLDVVVIDYLQLLSSERNMPREQQVAQISRQLKVLARELDVAVVVPAQLNRETVRRGKPALADLRESGAIEADADVVLLLWRTVFPPDHELAGQYNGKIAVEVPKNRHGKTFSVELPWRAHYSTIGTPGSRFNSEPHVVEAAS